MRPPLESIRRDRAGGREGGKTLRSWNGAVRLVEYVAGGVIGRPEHVRDDGNARRHPQRPEDVGDDDVFPRRMIHAAGHLAGGDGHRVRVLELGAERHGRFRGRRGAEVLLACEHARFGGEIGVSLEAGAVAEHVADGDLRVRLGIGELEIGEKLARVIVERQQSSVGAARDLHRSERFRARADGEERVGRDRQIVLDVAHSERLHGNDAVIAHDGEDGTGDVLRLHLLLDDASHCG
jgi:hypothetical protein